MIERICKSCMQQYTLQTEAMNEEEAEYCPFCGAHEDDDPEFDNYQDMDSDYI
mgnify:FL=1|jgi:hypothetical protein